MTGMTSPHSYASPAWQWALLLRPTSMYAQATTNGQSGCAGGDAGCLDILYSMPNPLLWYASIAATVFLVYRFVLMRDWRYAVVLVGIAATWLPWMAYPERTIFQFYTIAFEPYLVLALVAVAGILLGTAEDPSWRRVSGLRIVAIFVGVAVIVSVFFWPLWSGTMADYWFIAAHWWLPTWR